jgi:diacylglycerol kinase (ATP)
MVVRLLRATLNSWNGLIAAARKEAAFQQELVLLLIGVPLAFWVTSDAWRRVALIAVLLLLLTVELLNTALERLADEITRETHPAIGYVKDVGSAAVLMALLLAGFVWLVALGEHFGLL